MRIKVAISLAATSHSAPRLARAHGLPTCMALKSASTLSARMRLQLMKLNSGKRLGCLVCIAYASVFADSSGLEYEPAYGIAPSKALTPHQHRSVTVVGEVQQ